MILVFVVVGLLGNIHLVTAMNMTLVLLIAYLIRQRCALRCLPVALASGAAAAVAALPYLWYYFSLRTQMTAGHAAAPTATLMEAIRIGDLSVFYPGLLKSLLDWRVLAGVIVLGIPAAAVLVKIERYITQNVRLWIGLILGSVFVAMGMHGISQAVGAIWNTAPPVIDFIQAAELLMLPLYVLLGQAITNLFRLLRAHPTMLRWVLAALLAAWMIPSDNLRVARRNLAELATTFVGEGDKPDYVLKHREQDARLAELTAIADYASGRPGSMYITDHGEFRVLARRPILAARNDVRYLYYLAPWRLGGWLDRFEKQEELLGAPAGAGDGDAVAAFVTDLVGRQPELADVKEWYLILRTSPSSLGPLQPVTSANWGTHYTLYRIR